MRIKTRACLLPLLLMMTDAANAQDVPDNIRISGVLGAEACVVLPEDQNVDLDFLMVIEKSLYLYQRTPGREVTLHLAQCDVNILTNVTVSFLGNESQALPGYLALDRSSSAGGVAIGLEKMDGTPIAINKTGVRQRLTEGDTFFRFKAFVQGEPLALSGQRVVKGSFNATATFQLEYD